MDELDSQHAGAESFEPTQSREPAIVPLPLVPPVAPNEGHIGHTLPVDPLEGEWANIDEEFDDDFDEDFEEEFDDDYVYDLPDDVPVVKQKGDDDIDDDVPDTDVDVDALADDSGIGDDDLLPELGDGD